MQSWTLGEGRERDWPERRAFRAREVRGGLVQIASLARGEVSVPVVDYLSCAWLDALKRSSLTARVGRACREWRVFRC